MSYAAFSMDAVPQAGRGVQVEGGKGVLLE